MLQIAKRHLDPDVTVLDISGRIALGRDSERMQSFIKELQGEGVKKIIFDLTAVDYIDSSGLGILMFCFASMRNAGGGLRIAGASGRVRELMEFTRLDAILPLYATVEEANSGFSTASA